MDGASLEPEIMSLDLLREITDGFSEERKLGSGSFGKVYLGVHRNGQNIAVKKLYDMPGIDDEQFWNEFKNLTRLRHKNIVQLVGYCHDIQEVHVRHEGKLLIAEKTHRVLCLEYMCNGSLDKYLSDECDRYDWQKGYRIINGICQGLNYLHNELKPPIYHLDLKPANVLLDENMVPRIADFGISRLFRDEVTRATKSSLGTDGYLPPEYIKNNLVSNKFDIFSLGVVIIKIMARRAGYYKRADMSSQEFTNLEDRHKRPTIQDIVDRLKKTETECTDAARKDWLLIFQEANRNTFPRYSQDSNVRHGDQIYHGSTFNQDTTVTAHSNYFEQNPRPREARLDDDSRFFRNDNQEYPSNGHPLPGIGGFQIAGEPRPGFTLRACGWLTNGTTRCRFQWVRCIDDDTMEPIEGATMDYYVVTVDDVGSLLAVDCTPMDDNGRQGDLVREFANNKNKITCDPQMQNDIDTFISRGTADFDVFVMKGYSPDEWQKATLTLTLTGYRIYFSHKDEAVLNEEYSPSFQIKIPHGRTTQFVLVRPGGVSLQINTGGITVPNNENNDVRLRDQIVLAMRTLQDKKFDAGESVGNLHLDMDDWILDYDMLGELDDMFC